MARAESGAIRFHRYDLPGGIDLGPMVAVDTETTGLNLARDRLCLVQLAGGTGDVHLVHFPSAEYDAPNLKRLLADETRTKLFHFARFDLAVLETALGVSTRPVYCTKVASKLVRTYSDRHGLKDLCQDLLSVELSKEQQSSDWGAADLSDKQKAYAASDVRYLHRLKDKLDAMLAREGRMELAEACFAFLPMRAKLDLAGWAEADIFAH